MNLIKLTIILTFLFPAISSAFIFVEPQVGLQMGAFEHKRSNTYIGSNSSISTNPDDNSISINPYGYAFDGKVGFNPWFFMFFYDIHYARLVYNSMISTNMFSKLSSGSAEELSHSALVGLSLRNIRFWGGVVFDSRLVIEDPTQKLQYNGNGFRIGGGIKFASMISTNLEYTSCTYDRGSGKDLPSSTNVNNYKVFEDKARYSSFLLSLSLPLSI